jgi:PDZ domain-containing protein
MAPGRGRWFVGTLLGVALLVVLAAVPLPWYVIAPGSAVDLTRSVEVAHGRPTTDRFFLTDVSVSRASPLRLLFAFLPGVTIAPEDRILPHGISPHDYGNIMRDAMDESQGAAAVVAERAAGYGVTVPPLRFAVAEVSPASAARGVLAPGDWIRRVGGRTVRSPDDVRRALEAVRSGELVGVAYERGGRSATARVRTVTIDGRVRLGVVLEPVYGQPKLPVPVHYAMEDIGGSSGGLMMALRIYDALHGVGGRRRRDIAGTGTLTCDGRVGPIEGTPQKLIAAKRAGARVFFVPRENFADIAGERDVRVVPVGTFAEALRALET